MPAFTENDDRVTCSSCQFRYPKVRGFCPICGFAALSEETSSPPRGIRYQSAAPEHKTDRTIRKRLQESLDPLTRSGRLWIAAIILLFALFFSKLQSGKTPHESTPAPVPAVSGAAIPPIAAVSENAPLPISPADREFTDPESVEPKAAAIADPAALWKRVGAGSTTAEIGLAKLYLDGNGVTQNCEQAHLLLLAASKRGSRTASNLLSSAYAQRCP